MTGNFVSQGHGKTPALLWKLSEISASAIRETAICFLDCYKWWASIHPSILCPTFTASVYSKVLGLLTPALQLTNTLAFWWLLNCSVPQQDAFLVYCWDFQKQVALNIENLDLFPFTLVNRLVAPLFGSGLARAHVWGVSQPTTTAMQEYRQWHCIQW